MTLWRSYLGFEDKIYIIHGFLFRYVGETVLVSYTAHIAGAVVGLFLGIVLLRNLSYKTWEKATWWCSLLIFLGLFLGAIVWNAIEIFVNGDINLL